MSGFTRKKGDLLCDGLPVETVCKSFKTPFYLYSFQILKERMREFREAFSDHPALVCYALKANSNGAVLSLAKKEGLGADVVSGGEMERALEAGISPKKIVFAGVGKTEEEILKGLKRDILAFNVESLEELKLIAKVAKEEEKKASISLRVNPDIDPETHPYISTGMKENKFGLDLTKAKKGYKIAKKNDRLSPIGIHAHIGSQITEVGPFKEVASNLVEFAKWLAGKEIELQFIDIGGGLGIPYKKDENSLSVKRYAEIIKSEVNELPFTPRIIVEPGRSIVGPAGILVSEVTYVKEKHDKTFFVLDAGMSDFLRPSLYEAWHNILPVKSKRGRGRMTADIVGPVCESSDFFAKDRKIQKVKAGEKLAVMDAGAYGYSMASNYNSRARPAEILVKDNDAYLIREREKIEDLTRGERIPPFLK